MRTSAVRPQRVIKTLAGEDSCIAENHTRCPNLKRLPGLMTLY